MKALSSQDSVNGFLTLKQLMLKVVGEMQLTLDYQPNARKQVEASIHHWQLAMTAEGCDTEETKSPNRD